MQQKTGVVFIASTPVCSIIAQMFYFVKEKILLIPII
jgi:hypothetical protein